MIEFTKEQLIERIEKQIDINATIIERLGDDSAAVSELAVSTAAMDIKILDAALATLTKTQAAPQQGVKSAFAAGMARYGAAMQQLARMEGSSDAE